MQKMDGPITRDRSQPATVYLVGAGPGDPGLITARALELLRGADAVVYDALANPVLLDQARRDAELIHAGKRAKEHKLTQEETNALLVELARAGKTTVRLKGGDPYVFGRGSEEALYLHARGVPCEVVPGITAGIAGPAAAGVPVTHRQVAVTCTFITGHEDPTKDEAQADYAALAALLRAGGTLCFYMGMGRLGRIVDELVGHGVAAETPAAVVQWATTPRQRSVQAPMREIQSVVDEAGLGPPAIVVVGDVAGLDREALNWFERRPLFGQTLAVTRTRHQASELSRRLLELGARVIETPTIDIVYPDDWQPIREAVRNLPSYDWLVLTSVNGVAGLKQVIDELSLDARHLAGVNVAAIGDATAEAIRRELGVRPDLVPTRFVAESLAAELIAQHDVAGKRFLLLRADIARPALVEKLTEAGAEVTERSIYRTQPADALPDELYEILDAGQLSWVTFTSSSTVRNFVALIGGAEKLAGVKVASIGPITSDTVREMGLAVTIEAGTHNIAGLVEAIRSAAASDQ